MSYQARVRDWVRACFGQEVSRDVKERGFRFLEEALELMQASGCSKEDVLRLVDYTYNRPKGAVRVELGQTGLTLVAFADALGVELNDQLEAELEHVWKDLDRIRQKWLTKPKNSPLPMEHSNAR